MNRLVFLPSAFASFLLLLRCELPAAQPTSLKIQLDVDAREISRQLLHARVEIPVEGGNTLALWYPKWLPGTHAPGGPVQNIGGFRLETAGGEAIQWERDPLEAFRFTCTVPEGTHRIVARIDYICNQPTANSTGVDSFGDPLVGIINWNTCLVYPQGPSIDDIQVTTRLQLPDKWKFGTALKVANQKSETIEFAPVTLRELVDNPLICGEHFRTIELHPASRPKNPKQEAGDSSIPAFMHLTSEAPNAIQLDDKLIGHYRNLVSEAIAMFGGAHFDEYHFLVVCTDQLPRNGLEHLSCSFNVVAERELIDDKQRKDWPAYLLPHEFVHSWCGKFRRPAAMVTTNFHTPEQTTLLWVYEGLAQYLGEVLTVRSGLVTTNEYSEWLASTIDFLIHQVGRQWRSLEDTAIASHLLRAHSQSWGHLRRSQDYYDEGLLLWLEADAIIRQQSDNKRSLDDFCKKFMGTNVVASGKAPKRESARKSKPTSEQAGSSHHAPRIAPYQFEDIIEALNAVARHDWEKFIRERVEKPLKDLPLDVVGRLGYRLQYDTKPPSRLEERERERKYVSALDSLGLNVSAEGRISAVVPGLPADKAGLAPGMTIQGVNDRKFSPQRLKDAIADSVMNRKIDFLILEGDRFRSVTVPYSDGLKYLKLVRDTNKRDILAQILKPLESQ